MSYFLITLEGSLKKSERLGNGRCNFNNIHASLPKFFLNPHLYKLASLQYSHHDFIALIEKHDIAHDE